MPYQAKRKGNNYIVLNTETGETKATHRPPKARAKALKQIKLLQGIEHGWTPTGEPDTFTRRFNGRKVKLRLTGGKKNGAKRQGKEGSGSTATQG